LIEREIAEAKARAAAQKTAHPDWPTHQELMWHPGHDHPEITGEWVPIQRWNGGIEYCRYCYTEHADWWLMDNRDYYSSLFVAIEEQYPVILCGRCRHTNQLRNPA
jgi:hypothetical protein